MVKIFRQKRKNLKLKMAKMELKFAGKKNQILVHIKQTTTMK